MQTKRQSGTYPLLMLALISTVYLTSLPTAAQTHSGLICRHCPFPMHASPGAAITEGEPQALLQMSGYEAPLARVWTTRGGEGSPVAVQPSDVATRVLQAEILKVHAPDAPLVIVALGQLKSGGWTGPRLEPIVYAIEPSRCAGSDTLFCRNPMHTCRLLAQAASRLPGRFFDLR
jgi:hypothetical protein